MTERGILFSGAMVRALLDGSKTQTRRIMKPQPVRIGDSTILQWRDGLFQPERMPANSNLLGHCPYGQPGDRLWVRETWQEDPEDDGTWAYTQYMGCKGSSLSDIPKRFRKPDHCLYRATWTGPDLIWRPSIHMPRWASRILLEILSVRVERLQDISEADALAEGPAPHPAGPVCAFSSLWRSINGVESWVQNPWVWVVEFRRIKQ